MSVLDRTDERLQALESWLVEFRRDLHRNPGLGFEVQYAASKVAETLRKAGLEVREGIGKTGVVGVLRGGQPGKTIAVRSDMDALPIHEENEVPYRSRTQGLMHACGHDVHTTISIGTALALAEVRDRLSGTVVFLHQPAEENIGGARPMIEDGALADPPVDAVVGLHVWPGLTFGAVGICEGPMMAAKKNIDIEILGTGGHAAQPQKCVDAVLAASQAIVALQSVVSRNVPPIDTAVLSITQIQAGENYNVLPDRVRIKGTIRAYKDSILDLLIENMERVLKGISGAHGARYSLEPGIYYPAVNNDPALTRRISEILQEKGWPVLPVEPSMSSEDFSYYQKEVPGTFLRLGVTKEGEAPRQLHTPTFNVDEKTILNGARVFCRIVMGYLNVE